MFTNVVTFSKKLPGFLSFLKAAGAEVLQTTNEWELLRFRTGDVTNVVYRNAKGQVTFAQDSEKAWSAYIHHHSWKPPLPTPTGTKQPRPKKASPVIRTVRERDGDLCFYCREPVAAEEASLEHLVSHSHGGPSHLSNLFIAHRKCNSRAGHLSAPEKIRLHVVAELKRAASEKA